MNEQWQDYWAVRFSRHGYDPVDAVRPAVWYETGICWYTKQNTLLYARADALDRFPKLRAARDQFRHLPLSLVHPDMYLRSADPRNRNLREVAGLFPKTLAAAGRRWWRRLQGRADWRAAGAAGEWVPPPRPGPNDSSADIPSGPE